MVDADAAVGHERGQPQLGGPERALADWIQILPVLVEDPVVLGVVGGVVLVNALLERGHGDADLRCQVGEGLALEDLAGRHAPLELGIQIRQVLQDVVELAQHVVDALLLHEHPAVVVEDAPGGRPGLPGQSVAGQGELPAHRLVGEAFAESVHPQPRLEAGLKQLRLEVFLGNEDDGLHDAHVEGLGACLPGHALPGAHLPGGHDRPDEPRLAVLVHPLLVVLVAAAGDDDGLRRRFDRVAVLVLGDDPGDRAPVHGKILDLGLEEHLDVVVGLGLLAEGGDEPFLTEADQLVPDPGREGRYVEQTAELGPLGFQPVDRVGRLLHEGPHQTGVGQPVRLFHMHVEGLLHGEAHFVLLLEPAADREHAFGEVRHAPGTGLLLEDQDRSAPIAQGKGRTQPGRPAPDDDDISFHFLRLHIDLPLRTDCHPLRISSRPYSASRVVSTGWTANRRECAMSVWLQAAAVRGDEFPRRDRYPFNIPSLQGKHELHFRRPVTFFVGENGCGKSTLLKALAYRSGLHLWGQPEKMLRKGELKASALSPYLQLTLADGSVTGGFFSAETFRGWAEFLDDVARLDPGQAKYHGGAELTARSHGEGILAYLGARYQRPGLYFLDEPEAALSPASQLELLRILDADQARGEAQFVIATHSPILMALPGGQVFEFSETGMTETSFPETGHFRLYRDFLADPGAFLLRRQE